MEIITLLRANIRRKKGTFISIALLIAIITAVVTAIFSVRDNYEIALTKAYETSRSGDVIAMIGREQLTDDIRQSLEESALVDHVEYHDALLVHGVTCGEKSNGNGHSLTRLREGIQVFRPGLAGFEEKAPELSAGEIYLPLGMRSMLSCETGDRVCIDLGYGTEEFVIKGFVQEPMLGALTIGWKNIFISDEDFAAIEKKCMAQQEEENYSGTTLLFVFQAEECGMSSVRFQRELNLETKLIDMSVVGLCRDQSERFSTLMPDIIMDVVLVFIAFLFLIVLIVMSHSIGTEIEIDYTLLGILKSQGFDNGRIRLLFFLQYILAQSLGIAAGIAGAMPLAHAVSGVVMLITGVLPQRSVSVGKCMLYIAAILLCSLALIWIKTRKIAEISPVKAISGGREDIYFDSRLMVPLEKRALTAGLAFRQFTSNKRRYAGTIFIAAILVFFMITVNLISDVLSSRSAQAAMGMMGPDITIRCNDGDAETYMKEAEGIMEAHADILEKNRIYQYYSSLNGENLCCRAYCYPEYIAAVLKGREPRYDNEILITEMVGEALELDLGDEVTVSYGSKDGKFVISGIFQLGLDSGMCFAMNFAGAERIGVDTGYGYAQYVLEDGAKIAAIVDEINAACGDVLEAEDNDAENGMLGGAEKMVVDLLKVIIYSFSILFAFVVVRMVCSKSFVQERRDIGIYKALGFTSSRLRLGFAVRFWIVALAGGIVGLGLSILFSAKLLSAVLRLIGLSKVVLEFSAASVLIPVGAVSLSFFVFAYLVSGNVRKVEVKELVVE